MFIIYSIVKDKIKIKYRLVCKVLKLTNKCKESYNSAAKYVLRYRILLLKHFETNHLKFICNKPQEKRMCKYIAASL